MEGRRYLLDTNILSDLVRNPAGRIEQRIKALGEETVCTSLVVSAELRFGENANCNREKRLGGWRILAPGGWFAVQEPYLAGAAAGACRATGATCATGATGATP